MKFSKKTPILTHFGYSGASSKKCYSLCGNSCENYIKNNRYFWD